jgi:Tfp pilus assembly protein FimV
MGLTERLMGLLFEKEDPQADKAENMMFATQPLNKTPPARPHAPMDGHPQISQPEAGHGSLLSELDRILSSDDPIEAIYQTHNLTQPDFTAEQMLEILDLVSDEPPEKRSQKVEILLKIPKRKYGITPQSIQQDADRKFRILAKVVKTVSDEREREITQRQSQIDELQKQIDKAQQEIEQKRKEGERMDQLCHDRARRLKEVIDYFGGDISASD